MSQRVYTPRPYQGMAIDFMADTPRCNLWAGMGTGKTSSVLALLELLLLAGDEAPTLVLGPKRVAAQTWPNEARKWQPFNDLVITPIVGDNEARQRKIFIPSHIHTINYEQLPWLVEFMEHKRIKWPWKTVVADEATRLKGFRLKGQGGKRTGALGKVAHMTDRWINLTGTPSPNGLKDLWGQNWFVDNGDRLGRTHEAFMDRWFRTDPYTRAVEAMPGSEALIHAALSDITLSIRSEDWFDIQKPIENTIKVQLPPTVRKQYAELEKEMFVQLECGTEIEVFNAAALTNKCRQFANGAVYTQPPQWAGVHDEKLEALESIVNEANGASVLVSYEFVSDKARILAKFKDAVDVSTPTGFKAFMERKKQIGVAHPKSMGHGIDGMQDVCNIAVYYGYTWDLELHQQILERIGPVRQMQAGHDRNVFVHYIVCEDTLDEAVLERHHSKRSVQDSLMAAMKKHYVRKAAA